MDVKLYLVFSTSVRGFANSAWFDGISLLFIWRWVRILFKDLNFLSDDSILLVSLLPMCKTMDVDSLNQYKTDISFIQWKVHR